MKRSIVIIIICVLFFVCGGRKEGGQESGTLVREDIEGLVRIVVVNGTAFTRLLKTSANGEVVEFILPMG